MAPLELLQGRTPMPYGRCFGLLCGPAARISGGASRSMRLVQQFYSVVITYDLHSSDLFPLDKRFFDFEHVRMGKKPTYKGIQRFIRRLVGNNSLALTVIDGLTLISTTGMVALSRPPTGFPANSVRILERRFYPPAAPRKVDPVSIQSHHWTS